MRLPGPPAGPSSPAPPRNPQPLPRPAPPPPPRPARVLLTNHAGFVLACAAASTAMGITLLVVVASRINGAQAVAGAWNVVLLLSLFWLHFLTSRLTKATQ